MKINKWTLGLAAIGLVSLAPGVRADGTNAPAPIPLTTALSATTISGYVDTSMVWNPGTGNANTPPYAFAKGKADGFNLDSADVKIARAPDESQWAAGYTLELQYGPDAINPFGGPIRQAYVELRAPVGNGLDFQIGQWDNILGFEVNDAYRNPNWTRSYGYSFEPQTHTGVLATYKFSDAISAQVGVADTLTSAGNARLGTGTTDIYSYGGESKKAVVSLVTLTAPDSWGSLKNSTLSAGFDFGPSSGATPDREHLFIMTQINTPVKDLTFGAAYDSIWHTDVAFPAGTVSVPTSAGGTVNVPTPAGSANAGYFMALAGYVHYQLTDKASINGRGEWAHGDALGIAADSLNGTGTPGVRGNPLNNVIALTGTFEYDLWANVISRLEVRWDHAANGQKAFDGTVPGTGTAAKINDVLVAANIIYKF
jgi:hypothetical protein